jgi:hypothetical protein
MNDLVVMWGAYAFAFAALGLYLAHLWFETRKITRDEARFGIGKKEEKPVASGSEGRDEAG